MNIFNTDITTSDNFKSSLLKRLNLCLLIIIITLATSSALWIDVKVLGNDLTEKSFTEFSEQILLVISSLTFVWLAKKHQHLRSVGQLIASFFLVILIRELDVWFDLIVHGAWIYPALLVTATSIAYAAKSKATFKEQMLTFLKTDHMGLLVVGMMMLLISSRIFGMGELWELIMGDNYVRTVKNTVEEGGELFSYYIITVASIGITYNLNRQEKGLTK